MNLSLYQAASALNATSRWQEVVADNLAASNVPGYKRTQLTVAAVEAGLLPSSALQQNSANSSFAMPKAQLSVDFSPGEMHYTGQNTDLAIDGPGFFEVQLPNGQTGYTRNGQLRVDAQNRLITTQGFPVLGDNGPIQLEPGLGGTNSDSFAVSPDGTVSQGNVRRGKLRLVEFADPQRLTRANGGIYLPPANAPLPENPNPTSTVLQRSYEGSNASPTLEMATLMTTMRSFEANQRSVQLQDERMGKVISELSPA